MNDIKTLGYYLSEFASAQLDDAVRGQFTQLVDLILADLSQGSSCSRLSLLSKASGIVPDGIIELLLTSGLAVISDFTTVEIPALPLVIINDNNDYWIYVSKYLAYEASLAAKIIRLAKSTPNYPQQVYQEHLAKLTFFSQSQNYPNSEQLSAITHAANCGLSVISGGPGTGKTTTVTMLLWLFYQLYGEGLVVKICAPTGKAATRVRDSVAGSCERLLNIPEFTAGQGALQKLLTDSDNFSTIHKLLGYIPENIYFRHDELNPLAIDVLIVDESSMIGLPLFSKLVAAIDEQRIKHIVFLGDKNQLSSVEEGAVFAALMQLQFDKMPAEPIDLFSQSQLHKVAAELNISNRNQPQIAQLANLILQQDYNGFIRELADTDAVKLHKPQLALIVQQFLARNGELTAYVRQMQEPAVNEWNYEQLINCFNQQSILCLTNQGQLGCENLNRLLERGIRQQFAFVGEWYNGRPIIIQQNDYNLGLFNGDIGICRIKDGKISIKFSAEREFIPEILPEYKPAYAITIHKSQGSEYHNVTIVLGALANLGDAVNLLTRELFYTALTRARQQVIIYGDKPALKQCLMTVTKRLSGLPILFKQL